MNASKAIALIITAAIFVLLFSTHKDCQTVGIAPSCTLTARLLYPLFHASFIHALINTWALLSVTFLYKPTPGSLLTAYIIAVVAPTCVLQQTPTVGLSAMCYALFGYIVPQVHDKVLYNTAMAISITAGILIPGINGAIHLYAYVTGIAVAILNHPFKRKVNK